MTIRISSKSALIRGLALLAVSLFLVNAGSLLLDAAELPPPALSLTLIPPSPVTDQVALDIRAAVRNSSSAAGTFELSFYLDAEKSGRLLHRSSVEAPPGGVEGVRFQWPTTGQAGAHKIICVAKEGPKSLKTVCPVKIIITGSRSTERLGGAWVDIYHHDEAEGRPFNDELGKMTDQQWKELVRAMHDSDQNLLVISMMFQNFTHRGQHAIETEGYKGKAYYPSSLYPGRMPIASADPLEAILSEADKLGMHVMPGIGCYAFFDYSQSSLEWHKQVAQELWARYGHHPSFYGWYISEEKIGSLGDAGEREEIVKFFQELTPALHQLTPDKPVMLAINCFGLSGAEDTYRKLLPNLDILCPFGFARMPAGDMTGEEASSLLQSLCDQAGCHLWMDLESFEFRNGVELYPRPINGLIGDLVQFPNFEKILHYQFPGMMSSPDMSRQPGGQESVQLYEDYLQYLDKPQNKNTATGGKLAASTALKAPLVDVADHSIAKPIRGTWLNLAYQDTRNKYTNPESGALNSAAAWRVKIGEMSDMGIKYLILMAVANECKAYYESDFMPPAYDPGQESPVSAIMNAADEHGMKVFMSCGWVTNQDDNLRNTNVLAGQLKIMKETARKFGGHKSFYGWYLPCEDSITPFLPDEAVDSVNGLAAEARQLTPKAKILISPYGLSGAVFDKKFTGQLAKLDVDIIAYQDEVGCVRVPLPSETMKQGFANLRAAHDQVPRIALWANIESFTWAGGDNRRDVALVPAAFPRLLSQMAGVTPYADEILSFAIQGMMDKPGSTVPIGQPVWSARLYEHYVDYLAGRQQYPLLAASFRNMLTNDATGKPVTLVSQPSAKYARGNLTGGKLGVENYLDPAWLGFDNQDLDATIDLGQIQPLHQLAARFLQFAPAAILLPSRVEFAISNDGVTFRPVASVTMEAWPNNIHDYWIDMAATGELSTQGRYVRVHAINSGGWLFADKIFVNPAVDRQFNAPSGLANVPKPPAGVPVSDKAAAD
jgi:hypothetical protein